MHFTVRSRRAEDRRREQRGPHRQWVSPLATMPEDGKFFRLAKGEPDGADSRSQSFAQHRESPVSCKSVEQETVRQAFEELTELFKKLRIRPFGLPHEMWALNQECMFHSKERK